MKNILIILTTLLCLTSCCLDDFVYYGPAIQNRPAIIYRERPRIYQRPPVIINHPPIHNSNHYGGGRVRR